MAFDESHRGQMPIRKLGLTIENSPLEAIVNSIYAELEARGIRLKPRFYLSTEWGVPTGTIAVAIPFYLASTELTEVHGDRVGHVEGFDPHDIARYLRHEVGHAVNYGYKLYERTEWIERFGSITQPYVEDYRPVPFSERYVVHLPGWYAQKHPDEDWAETFAVWLTPGVDWKKRYEAWPPVIAKLAYCDRVMSALSGKEPIVTSTELDEDVGEIDASIDQFYEGGLATDELPRGLDGAIRAIFDDFRSTGAAPASELLQSMERDLLANVYRWTGHFPERTRALLQFLSKRAKELKQVYPIERKASVMIAVTTLVTALAMNHVIRGTYASEASSGVPGPSR